MPLKMPQTLNAMIRALPGSSGEFTLISSEKKNVRLVSNLNDKEPVHLHDDFERKIKRISTKSEKK